ncbi:MAG: hypothetical protein ACP6IS_06095 [Candidatus Asgardarchaeia archaeon]
MNERLEIGPTLDRLYHEKKISFFTIFKYDNEKKGFTPVITKGIKKVIDNDDETQKLLVKVPHFISRTLFWGDEEIELSDSLKSTYMVIKMKDGKRLVFFTYDELLVGFETNNDENRVLSEIGIIAPTQNVKVDEKKEDMGVKESTELLNKIDFLVNIEEKIDERVEKLIEALNRFSKELEDLKKL